PAFTGRWPRPGTPDWCGSSLPGMPERDLAPADLLPEENALVLACLECVASGRVIPHDWEFQTLFGIEPAQVVAVADAWPNVDDSDEIVGLAKIGRAHV